MKENTKRYPLYQRMLSFAMAALLVFGIIPLDTRAATTAEEYTVEHTVTVADPQTIGRPGSVYGDNTLNAGKVTVGKSVHNGAVTVTYGNGKSQTFTPAQNNFIVTSSQAAQIMGLASESAAPVDVVFVLDTSNSMEDEVDDLVTAANNAIRTLLSANPNNRVGVVAFSGVNGRGTSGGAAANVLSPLAHYDGEGETAHLTLRSGYMYGRGTQGNTRLNRDATSQGTNIHAGIVVGARELMNATDLQVNGVTRIPFLVVMSDGEPSYAVSGTNWYDPASLTGQIGNLSQSAGIGFLPALTAAYYKGKITEKYFGADASKDNRCFIYTLGLGLDSISNKDIALMTVDPAGQTSSNSFYNTFEGYWNNGEDDSYVGGADFNVALSRGSYTITAATITATKNAVNGLSSTGASLGYTGGYKYNDKYFSASQGSELNGAFDDVITTIQQQAMASPTHIDEEHGADFSGYVTFTDPIGEYMEVKKIFGVVADGNYYQGKSFAQNIYDWDNASAEFKTSMIRVLKERCRVTGAVMSDAQAEAFLKAAAASDNQANYDPATGEFDNSIVWWGKSFQAQGEEDVQIQWLGFADNDTVEYITSAQIPEGADYVCRSYYFWGEAGGTAENPNHEYLSFVVRVQRSLKAPYQETVVISAPASLLSSERVLITEKTDASGKTTYTAVVTEADPARVVYEVGLRSDINAFNVDSILSEDTAYLGETAVNGGQTVNTNYDAATGTYHFYTNDWNRTESENSHHRAMTHVTFDAAVDNAFYTYTEDTPIYTKTGDTYTLYNGSAKPSGIYYYARDVYDWSASTATGDTHTAVKKTEYILVDIPANSAAVQQGTDSWYITKGVYKASSLSVAAEDVPKDPNRTQTSTIVAHPHRTESENNSHYTVLLGNNGKLSLKAADTKSVSITKPNAPVITDGNGKVVMVGDVLTYTVKIINGGDTDASAVATDVIPVGTEYVENSATEGGEYNSTNKTITWNIDEIPAGHFVEVSFQVKVTEAALTGEMDVATIDNRAHVELDNGFEYETNITKNPPEGKKVVDTNGAIITGSVDIPDVLVYRIRWHNDSGSTANVTVTDIIPVGTSYVENSASHNGVYDATAKTITWTLENVEAGASGVVSFRVNVNAAAGDAIENGAKVQIGENDPRVTNKTSVPVDKGNLVLSKDVITNGFAAAADQEFTLRITEAGLGMNGTFTMLKNGQKVDDGITFTNGVATVTIKHDDEIEIQGITAGAIISVTEDAKNGFTPVYAPAAGTVTIVKNDDVSVAVTNTYMPNAVPIQLQASKVLATDFDVDPTTFGFVAQSCDASGVVNTAKQPLTGEVTVSGQNKTAQIIFGEETFSAVGTYYYLISEINGGVAGVQYAAEQYIVQIDVTDNGSGQLKADIVNVQKRENENSSFTDLEQNSGIVFTNTYAPKETQLVLTGDKVLNGRDLSGGEFSFVVTENGKDVTYGINDSEGNIIFQAIPYTTVGDHTYIITEVNSGDHGITYSTQSFTVTVKVEDVNGQLVATPAYPAGGVVFENTYTPDGVAVELEAKKVLNNQSGTNRVLGEGEFSFVVKDAQGNEVAAGKNAANGKVTFTPIGYTKADAGKTYTYYISEIVPDLSADPYMHYDAAKYTVKVTVSYDSAQGILSTTTVYEGLPAGEAVPVFTNIQYPSSITVTPSGHKTTTAQGGTANVPDTTFAFTVVDMNGAEVGAGIGNANGDFLFSKLTYTEAGTYKYWLKETHAGQNVHGIEYDDVIYLMVVTVTKTNGKLEPTVAYYGLKDGGAATDPEDYTVVVNAPSFENTYDAKGQITLTAKKVLTNRTLSNGDFAFRLIRQDNNHEITGVVAADGTITFATLHFDLEDMNNSSTNTIHYKMSEIVPTSGKLSGVKYDESVHDVYVTITHNNDGTISAAVTDVNGHALSGTVAGNNTNVTFTNVYTPTEGTSATIRAKKVLTGRTLKSGEFSFNLYHVDGTVKTLVDTAANDANGLISFTRTYLPTVLTGGADSRVIKYELHEVNNHLGGVDYTKAATYWVLVTVTDNKEEGKLESTVKYYSDEACTEEITDLTTVQFLNAYDAESTTFRPEATKVLNNRALKDKEFLFVVKDKDDKTVSTGYNKADGTIVFTEIGYDHAGEYVYTVSETDGGRNDIGYSNAKYYLKVTVKDNLDGTMTATGEYFSDAECKNKLSESDVVFTNTYKPSSISVKLEATKILNGHHMQDGSFSFLVYDVTDMTKPVASGGNAEADSGVKVPINFSNIGYTFDMLSGEGTSRTFIYAISEQATTHGGVETDDSVYYAKVVLSHNAQTGELTTTVTYHTDKSCTDGNKISGVPGFVNTYDPADAKVVLQAEKTLINKKLEAGEFTFTLQGVDANQNKTNDASGKVIFDELTFTAPGVYEYTISEAVSTGWTADRYTLDHAFKVIVTVEDDLRGKLMATVTYHELLADGSYDATANLGAAEFINRYTAPAVTVDLTTFIDAKKTVKAPDGITYGPEGFTFKVTDTTGNTIKGWKNGQEEDMIGVSDAAGKITFPSFRFTTAGEYHYWIAEQPSNVDGMTDDLRVWEVHILVRYNEETGLLYIDQEDVKTYPVGRAASDHSAPEFVNVFEPAAVTLTLEATKLLEGRELKDREFLFYLMEGNTIVAQGYNDVAGKVKFNLTYTAEDIGAHAYTIKEMIPENTNNGITYDEKTYVAGTVNISYNTASHKLVASVGNTPVANGAVVSTGVKVTNQYTVNGTTAQINANKVVTANRLLKDKEFTFGLMDSENNVVATAKNNEAGWITFQLPYDKAGIYTYQIFEQAGEDKSLTYDENRYTVTVTVTDDLLGQLHAVVAYENNVVPTFVNEYRALPTTATVEAKKTLKGNKTLSAGDFTFELEREDGVKVTADNLADGLVKFGMAYDKAGVYTYTLREIVGNTAGVTYDDTEYTVTVAVTDNMEGALEATVSYDGLADGETVPTFVNSYKGKAASVQIEASKKLTGKTLTADAYSFTLTNKDNTKDVHTVKNDAKGNVVFELSLTEVGTYTYILAETTGTDANVTYDKNTYTVTVKVIDDLQGNLKAEVAYGTTDGKAPTFENIYTPSAITVDLTGEKTLKGRDMKAEEFTFEVRDVAGKVVATAKNTEKGELVFSGIELKAAGEYTFEVVEVKGNVKGMIYDDTKYIVTVDVVNENGVLKATVTEPTSGLVFKNTYKNPDPTNPSTGDDAPLLLLVGMMVVSGGAVAALLIDRKKRYASR